MHGNNETDWTSGIIGSGWSAELGRPQSMFDLGRSFPRTIYELEPTAMSSRKKTVIQK